MIRDAEKPISPERPESMPLISWVAPRHCAASVFNGAIPGNICMTQRDPHDEILRLETEIEKLTEVIASCRKAVLASKIALAAGGMCLLAVIVGAIRLDPVVLIGTIAAVIGGIVAFGSNTSTLKHAATSIKAAETLRAELIDKINFQVVGEADI